MQRCTEIETNYIKYKLSMSEFLATIVLGSFVLFGISFLCFDSYLASIFMLPCNFYFIKLVKSVMLKRRNKLLKKQFVDLCKSLSAQLIAGYSIENSIKECMSEMETIYGVNSYIYRELRIILNKLRVNQTIEKCFHDFSQRTDINEIKMFSEILYITKRNGGNMVEVIKMTADSLKQKMDVEREIETIIDEKKFEQYIMNFVPIIIILFLRVTSKEIINPLYTTLVGKIFMCMCIGIYIGIIYIEKKILDIKV